MSNFTPRLSAPESGNPYYNTKASGGYSTCIKGKPTELGTDVLRNCVGYALGRYHEIAGRKDFDLIPSTNAENLAAAAEAAGLATGRSPQLGALIVWAKGKVGDGSDGAGHVAVVEQISGTDIICSESGWNSGKKFWTQRYTAPYQRPGYTFIGFVYQPKAQDRWLRRGCEGEKVKLLQRRLIAAGYLGKAYDTGVFGNFTFGALLAYQLDSGLEVDGVCGPQTSKHLGVTL